MTSTVDLGYMCLKSTSTVLSLALSSSVRLSPTNHIDDDALAQFVHDLKSSSSSSAWISRGSNMHLTLDVAFQEDTRTERSILGLQESLTDALLKTPLWQQLRLKPSLTVVPLHSSQSLDRIVLALSRELHHAVDQPSSSHQLGVGVSNLDTKPPDDVPQLSLDEINLRMNFSYRPDAYSPTLDWQPLDPTSRNSPEHTHHEHLPTSSSTGRVVTANPQQTFVQHSNNEDLLTLIDAAVRLAISNMPTKAFPSIAISEVSSFKHLEDFCPTVWSLDYLSSIASRTVFIPTISHAISRMLQRTVRLPSLHAKLETMAQQDPGFTTVDQDDNSLFQTVTAVQRMTQTQTWQLMQARLRTRSIGQLLEPLYQAPRAVPGELTMNKEDIDHTAAPHEAESVRPQLSYRTSSLQSPWANGAIWESLDDDPSFYDQDWEEVASQAFVDNDSDVS